MMQVEETVEWGDEDDDEFAARLIAEVIQSFDDTASSRNDARRAKKAFYAATELWVLEIPPEEQALMQPVIGVDGSPELPEYWSTLPNYDLYVVALHSDIESAYEMIRLLGKKPILHVYEAARGKPH